MNDKPLYTLIPNKALDALVEKGGSLSDIVVYQVLCRHYNLEDNKCWPSLNLIAKLSGCSQRNVQRSINFLCSSGMVLRLKSKHSNNTFENNSYLIPHLVAFQIEKLSTEKKSPKVTQKITELSALEGFILKSIQESLGKDNMSLGRDRKSLLKDKKAGSKDSKSVGVETQSPANNTTINTTINITKNVKDNDGEITGFNQKRKLSVRGSSQHISEIGSLIQIKNEGFVQEIANALNDHKSIPFFRKIVSKFTSHEDSIYKCLSLTRETDETAGINTSRGAVFTDHIKREAEMLGIEL